MLPWRASVPLFSVKACRAALAAPRRTRVHMYDRSRLWGCTCRGSGLHRSVCSRPWLVIGSSAAPGLRQGNARRPCLARPTDMNPCSPAAPGALCPLPFPFVASSRQDPQQVRVCIAAKQQTQQQRAGGHLRSQSSSRRGLHHAPLAVDEPAHVLRRQRLGLVRTHTHTPPPRAGSKIRARALRAPSSSP